MKLVNENVTLALDEAYVAMYKFLEHEYEMVKSDEIGNLLGGMSLLEDGGTADPAAWDDWLQAVNKVLKSDTNIELKIKSD